MHISCIFVHIRRTKFMYISFPSPSTIYVKTIKEAVYWWDAFLSTVIKRKDYTYAAISPQHTSFIKAIVGNSKLMDLCSSNVLLMGTTYWRPTYASYGGMRWVVPISNLVVVIMSGPINIQPLTDSFHKIVKNAPKDNPRCVIYNNSPKS